MKVALINPLYKRSVGMGFERYYIRSGSRWPHSGVKIKGMRPHYLPFPFYLAYSASLLKDRGFDVHVVDAVALDIPEEELLRRVERAEPEMVFYEIATPTVDYDMLLAEKIKRRSRATLAVGGMHAGAFASQILRQNKAIDFVLRGECERALLGLSEYVGRRIADLPAGAVVRNGSGAKIIDNGLPVLDAPLDMLPFPFRDIFPSNDNPDPTMYWDGFCQKRPLVQMQGSRGCFHNCYFCGSAGPDYSRNRYSSFSPQRIVDEMRYAADRYGAREIYFDDDDFTADKKRVFSLCDEISKRGPAIAWSCMSGVANLTEDIIDKMAKSGCIGIKIGVESGSERVIRDIGKPLDLRMVRNIVRCCRRYRVKSHATFSVGHWSEDKADLAKTEKFVRALESDSIQVSIATPYPGTRFYGMARERGCIKDTPWKEYDAKKAHPIHRFSLRESDPGYLRKRIIAGWFLRRIFSPSWHVRHFQVMLRTLSGLGIVFFLRQLFGVLVDESKN